MADNESVRELRRFGLLVGGILAGIAVWPMVRRGVEPRLWLLLLGGALILLGLIAPRTLGWAHRGWMALAHALGWLNTRVLLGVVYFVVMTPTGLAMRAIGRDPLDRRLRDRESYWTRKERHREPRRSMERQF